MKSISTILILFIVLFMFKPSIVSIIEKKSTINFTKEPIEEEVDETEDKKLTFFKETFGTNFIKNQIKIDNKNYLLEIESISKRIVLKINTPPPKLT